MKNTSSPFDDVEEVDFYSPDFIPSRKTNESNSILDSAQSIYKYLDDKVYMMDDVKKAVSTFIYKALKGINSEKVLLIASESGTGKSFLISTLAEIVPNMVVTCSSSMVPQGYKGGNHLTTVLNKLDLSPGSVSFVVLDEFNRFLNKGLGSWADSGLLSELLVLFDDKDTKINASGSEEKPFWVNPKNIFFILLGSWSDITDNQSKTQFGFCGNPSKVHNNHRPQITKEQILDTLSNWPELIGRISRIVVNDNMSEESILRMLKSTKYSPIHKIEEELNVKIKVPAKKMREFAAEAYASGTGVRCVKNAVLEQVDEALFREGDNLKEVYIH